MRAPGGPGGRPCRRARRTETSAPSWHVGTAPVAAPGSSEVLLVSPQSPVLCCIGRVVELGPIPPPAFTGFDGTMDPSDFSPRPARLDLRSWASGCGRYPRRARSPAFSVFLSRRAAPATPEERTGCAYRAAARKHL